MAKYHDDAMYGMYKNRYLFIYAYVNDGEVSFSSGNYGIDRETASVQMSCGNKYTTKKRLVAINEYGVYKDIVSVLLNPYCYDDLIIKSMIDGNLKIPISVWKTVLKNNHSRIEDGADTLLYDSDCEYSLVKEKTAFEHIKECEKNNDCDYVKMYKFKEGGDN